MFKLTFLQSEEYFVGAKGLKYLSGDSLMVCEGGGVDEDVIHVTNSFVAINERMEDVIHHCLGGSR